MRPARGIRARRSASTARTRATACWPPTPTWTRRRAAQEFLAGYGADPDFAKLRRVQASFRARLTPKPWRAGVPAPPGQHPRDPVAQQQFGAWLLKYETASRLHATCPFVEAIGSAPPDADVRAIVDEHDRCTRAMERLSLA